VSDRKSDLRSGARPRVTSHGRGRQGGNRKSGKNLIRGLERPAVLKTGPHRPALPLGGLQVSQSVRPPAAPTRRREASCCPPRTMLGTAPAGRHWREELVYLSNALRGRLLPATVISCSGKNAPPAAASLEVGRKGRASRPRLIPRNPPPHARGDASRHGACRTHLPGCRWLRRRKYLRYHSGRFDDRARIRESTSRTWPRVSSASAVFVRT